MFSASGRTVNEARYVSRETLLFCTLPGLGALPRCRAPAPQPGPRGRLSPTHPRLSRRSPRVPLGRAARGRLELARRDNSNVTQHVLHTLGYRHAHKTATPTQTPPTRGPESKSRPFPDPSNVSATGKVTPGLRGKFPKRKRVSHGDRPRERVPGSWRSQGECGFCLTLCAVACSGLGFLVSTQ